MSSSNIEITREIRTIKKARLTGAEKKKEMKELKTKAIQPPIEEV